MAPSYTHSGDAQGLPRYHHMISNREPAAKKLFSTRSAVKWNWHLIPTQKNKLHARQCISQWGGEEELLETKVKPAEDFL